MKRLLSITCLCALLLTTMVYADTAENSKETVGQTITDKISDLDMPSIAEQGIEQGKDILSKRDEAAEDISEAVSKGEELKGKLDAAVEEGREFKNKVDSAVTEGKELESKVNSALTETPVLEATESLSEQASAQSEETIEPVPVVPVSPAEDTAETNTLTDSLVGEPVEDTSDLVIAIKVIILCLVLVVVVYVGKQISGSPDEAEVDNSLDEEPIKEIDEPTDISEAGEDILDD